jgi:hypothetical protein
VVAALVACVGVAILYLPPRGEPVHKSSLFARFETPTPYRRRVQELAAKWRAATLELRLLEYRERLRPELERRRALDIATPAVLFVGYDTLSQPARDLVTAALDTVWTRLRLGVTKISVGVAIQVARPNGSIDGPMGVEGWTQTYLLPDSTDRTSCIAMLTLSPAWGVGRSLGEPHPTYNAALVSFLQNGLGPCAYYAAFGAPGRSIARWMGERRFDLALYPWWDRPEKDGLPNQLITSLDPRENHWFWLDVYHYPVSTVACLGGRAEACRNSVLARSDASEPPPRLVWPFRWWQGQRLAGGDRYFADAVRAIGRDRFHRFWNSEDPVDTALTAALRRPIGEWTREWQAQLVPPVRLGPASRASDTLLSLLLAVAGLGFVAVTVARREVR